MNKLTTLVSVYFSYYISAVFVFCVASVVAHTSETIHLDLDASGIYGRLMMLFLSTVLWEASWRDMPQETLPTMFLQLFSFVLTQAILFNLAMFLFG